MNVIELNKVTKNFTVGSNEVTILKETSLTIDEGNFVAIVGPSGSGKSTLLTIMGALQSPTSGSISINEKNVSNLSKNELSSVRFNDIGFVLQASNLVPYLTLKEQFELKYKYKKEKYDKERVQEVMDKLSITHLADKYPDDISGGERQRAAIGLALVLSPKIILADEPTASLDTEKAYEVVEVFQKISHESNTTIIMVTHDTRMLSYCDRILEMNDGVLSEVALSDVNAH
ncbi:ABC transporter ATP-binding protein [Vagococcus xieshaowenii]|uniref:Putative hemin import ATP-binding protein HrtA n=1 Tax=Vagococcus xieshaowenii TaxID=2562451 RepID=A0AAJ5EGP4_9ENTE|nr:ABC transporter ATP-binding protein [Vagococcus xieshaowenii]QCA28762.1 ABC transporter ATP-binding protein [Vagococcus xieshaowenii]TFZ43037.1 ABC transporter ATP-binding protein [Vagococcus xieshaowenii]